MLLCGAINSRGLISISTLPTLLNFRDSGCIPSKNLLSCETVGCPSTGRLQLQFSKNSWCSSVCLQLKCLFLRPAMHYTVTPQVSISNTPLRSGTGKVKILSAVSLNWIILFGGFCLLAFALCV